MDKNKKYNVLQMGLSALLLSALGINPCYADNQAEIVSISCEASSSDQAIGISPDVFPKGDGVKLLTVKNNYPQEIEIVDITSKDEQSYAVLSKPSEPIKIPVGETHTFELQPGNCPYITTKEERVNFDFSYKTIVDGNTVNKILSIAVGVSCHKELDRVIEARDAALTALETLKLEKTTLMGEKGTAINELETCKSEKATLTSEKEAVLSTVETLKSEKATLTNEKEAALSTVETVKSEKKTLMGEKETAINALETCKSEKTAAIAELDLLQTACEAECIKAIKNARNKKEI
jgi:hypothetical protein